MIYLLLFLTFLEVGAVSFGGGYAMISLIREKMLSYGWLTEGELLDIIAVAESTPGPIAVNMATFVGATQAGFLGSVVATLGIVLPSFVIILIIATLMREFVKYPAVKAILSGIRPCTVGLIIGTALTLFLSFLLGIKNGIQKGFSPDIRGIFLLGLMFLLSFIYEKIKGKKPPAQYMIGVSALLGILVYGVL